MGGEEQPGVSRSWGLIHGECVDEYKRAAGDEHMPAMENKNNRVKQHIHRPDDRRDYVLVQF